MSIIKKLQRDFSSLVSAYEEASKADEIFHGHLKEGTKGRNIKEYKTTETYQKTLVDFKSAQARIESIVDEIMSDLNKNIGLERACAYLSIKQRHFRSGYFKESILRKFKKIKLSTEQKEMLGEIILDQIDHAGREFADFVKLIPHIKNADFINKVNSYNNEDNSYIKTRLKKISISLTAR